MFFSLCKFIKKKDELYENSDSYFNKQDRLCFDFYDEVFEQLLELIKKRKKWNGEQKGKPDKKVVMTLGEFIKNFSHNSEIYIENKNRFQMGYKYTSDGLERIAPVMDWELKFTDIADVNVIKIANVIRPGANQGITIVIDTDKEVFNYLPEKATRYNCPLWLYNKLHKCNIEGSISN